MDNNKAQLVSSFVKSCECGLCNNSNNEGPVGCMLFSLAALPDFLLIHLQPQRRKKWRKKKTPRQWRKKKRKRRRKKSPQVGGSACASAHWLAENGGNSASCCWWDGSVICMENHYKTSSFLCSRELNDTVISWCRAVNPNHLSPGYVKDQLALASYCLPVEIVRWGFILCLTNVRGSISGTAGQGLLSSDTLILEYFPLETSPFNL